METFILEVTPEQAQRWLDANVGNRAVSEKAVSNYARDMKEGRWAYTGDSIKFCSDGLLLDGQHRLHACVRSGHTFTTRIESGLPRFTPAGHAVTDFMDSNLVRTAGHALQMQGMDIGISNIIASMPYAASRLDHWITGSPVKGSKITQNEMRTWFDANPESETFAKKARTISHGKIGAPRSFAANLWWRFSQIDPVLADRFWEDYHSQDGKLPVTTGLKPVIGLHAALLKIRLTSSSMDPRIFCGYSITAWNMCRSRSLSTSVRLKGERIPAPK